MSKHFWTFCVLFSVALGVNAAPKADYWAYWDKANEANRSVIDHGDWNRILHRFVVWSEDSGVNRFNYAALDSKEQRNLQGYIDRLENLDPRNYSRLEQKAYWMNLYNALSVQAVLGNYSAALEAQNSAGSNAVLDEAWDKNRVKVAGKKLSLNDIEHRILRPIWKDHRIHFGLNCASLGCPNMPPMAFTARTLKTQLKDAGRLFVNDDRGVQYVDGQLRVSRIFDWYREDFARDDKALLKLFAHYASDRKALYLLGFNGSIDYHYDTRLNTP